MFRFSERKDFIERSLDAFWSDYKRPEISERVTERMHALGYSATVLDTVFNPDTYIAYNASGGDMVSMTFSTKPLVGVVALRGDETVRIGLDSHPLQTTKIPLSVEPLEYMPNAGALVHTVEHSYRTSNNNYAVNKSRPVLALRYSDNYPHVHPSTLVHEFTHVAQVLDRSTRLFASTDFMHPERLVDAFNDEFQAYDMQMHVYGDDKELSNHSAMEAAFKVELFRRYILTNANRSVDMTTLARAMDSPMLNGIVPQAVK